MRSGQDNAPSPTLPAGGDPIPGYRLIRKRGRGGGAEVWEADAPGGFRVALKIVNLSTGRTSSELRSLGILRGIRHPNLLPIFGAWQVERRLIIGMDLADRSLWDRFRESRAQGLCGIPRQELLGYLDAVAVAVDYLNDYRHTVDGRTRIGIQHRDLKPQNILLFGDHAKVADFGLARVMEQSVASHTGTCTLAYAAPEFFGKKTSRQSDQYALAVTYCQMRGGRMPFHGTTAQVAVGHLLNEPDLTSLPEPERPVVARALSKRPKDRWPDCRSFVDALKALDSAEGVRLPDSLPRQERDDDERQGDAVPPCPPLDPSLLMAYSDFIPMDTGGSDFPLELSGEGSDAEAAPHPDSGPSLPVAYSDFVPIDTGDSDFSLDFFESAGSLAEYRRSNLRLGAASRTGVSTRGGLSRTDTALPGASHHERPGGHGTVGRDAGRPARADWTRLGQYAAAAAIVFALLTWIARDLLGRPHRSAPTGPATAWAGSDRAAGRKLARLDTPPPARPARRIAASAHAGRKIDATGAAPTDKGDDTAHVRPPAPPLVAEPRRPERVKKPATAAVDSGKKPAPARPDGRDTTSPPGALESAVVAVVLPVGEGRVPRPARPPAPPAVAPGIDLPRVLAVRAGGTSRFRVRVRGVETADPVRLEFRGLPGGSPSRRRQSARAPIRRS